MNWSFNSIEHHLHPNFIFQWHVLIIVCDFLPPGFVLFKVSAGLDVTRQLNLHVTEQRDHLELL